MALLQGIFLCFARPKRKTRKQIRDNWISEKKEQPKESKQSSNQEIDEQTIHNGAVTKIQSIIRGYLGRISAKRKWKAILKQADEHWLFILWMKEEEERLRRLRAEARRQFAEIYTGDVIRTSIEFIVQASKASLTIQRTWRGHRCRMNLPRFRPIKRKRAIPREIKGRHSDETLRRVWARSLYEPKNSSYLHSTDFGYLEYDMWEYVDKSPEGRDVGLVTRKVKAAVKSEKEQYIVQHDRHAWVGLPVGFETESEAMIKRNPKTASQKAIQFNNPLQKRKMPQWMKEFILSLRKRDYKLERIPSVELRALVALGYDPQIEQQFLKGASNTDDSEQPVNKHRIGALAYDSYSGYLLIHRGEGRWTKLRNGEDILLTRSSIVDAEKLPLNKPNILSMISEEDKVHVMPKIKNLKSGLISVNNQELLSEESFHTWNHKSNFMRKYIKNNPNFLGEKFNATRSSEMESQGLKDDDLSYSGNSWISDKNQPITNNNKWTSEVASVLGGSKAIVRGTRKFPTIHHQLDQNNGSHYSSSVRDRIKETANPITEDLDSNFAIAQKKLTDEEGNNEAWLQLVKATFSGSKPISKVITKDTFITSSNHSATMEFAEELEEENDVWTRRVFKPKKEQESKVVVWPKKAKKHYSLLYNWIPQPLIHNAVNNLFYEKTYKDFRHESLQIFTRNIKEDIFNGTNKQKALKTSRSLIATLESAPPPRESFYPSSPYDQFGSSDILTNVRRSSRKKQKLAISDDDDEFNFANTETSTKNYGLISGTLFGNDNTIGSADKNKSDDEYRYYYDDGSQARDDNSSFESSVEVNTVQHPMRQKPVDIVTVKYPDLRRKNNEQVPTSNDDGTSVSSLQSHELSSVISAPMKWKQRPKHGQLLELTTSTPSVFSNTGKTAKNSVSALDRSHDFSAFIASADYPGTIPDLTSTIDVAQTSDNKVIYQDKERYRKFNLPQKTPGAKIAPLHPYSWH